MRKNGPKNRRDRGCRAWSRQWVQSTLAPSLLVALPTKLNLFARARAIEDRRERIFRVVANHRDQAGYRKHHQKRATYENFMHGVSLSPGTAAAIATRISLHPAVGLRHHSSVPSRSTKVVDRASCRSEAEKPLLSLPLLVLRCPPINPVIQSGVSRSLTARGAVEGPAVSLSWLFPIADPRTSDSPHGQFVSKFACQAPKKANCLIPKRKVDGANTLRHPV
jgi:hypothetical protein